MIVQFTCIHCGQSLRAGSSLVGTKGKCPECGKVVTVPDHDSKPQARGKVKAAEKK